MLALYACLVATFIPSKTRNDIYLPHVDVPDVAIRVHTPWLIITTLIRLVTFLNFGDRAWYDATLLTFIAPLWYYPTEYFIYRTVSLQMLLTAVGLDSFALGWMLLAREAAMQG